MKDLDRRLRAWLWSADSQRSRWGAFGMHCARLAYGLLRDFTAGELSLRAMSLVYSTMLAFVPLLALSFSVLQGLGFHRQLEPFLMNLFEPLGDRADEVTARVILFVDNISSSGLATLSLALLILTSLSMAQKVEQSLNFVWRVPLPRSFARRFSDYLSVLLVGPVLMSIAFGLIATVSSNELLARIRGIDPIGDWIAALGSLTPYVLIIGAFSLLFMFAPNTRVRPRAAAAGGLFAGLAWVASGDLFTRLVADASRYEAIYSGFAIVIMAMLWLYFSWLIVLLGAQLAFYVQYPDQLRADPAPERISTAVAEWIALATMQLVARAFAEPGRGVQLDVLATQIHTPRHLLAPVVEALRRAGLLVETVERRLVPGKALHAITLHEIVGAVRGQAAELVGHGTLPSVDAAAERIEAAINTALGGRTLADLAEQPAEIAHSASIAPAHAKAADDANR